MSPAQPVDVDAIEIDRDRRVGNRRDSEVPYAPDIELSRRSAADLEAGDQTGEFVRLGDH